MISQALMPKMLMDLGNKGQASELILKLIERFLDRINTTTIHASVSEFSAICGGSLPPSPNKVTIALYSDIAGSEFQSTLPAGGATSAAGSSQRTNHRKRTLAAGHECRHFGY